ncbi:MAG TPA: hypothetical protein VJ461_02565 [Candidatus Nanoarchaeia archaeon]|nr:hypothetical protein [Candidatus Nanoarchaeia archaeon]
MQEDDDNEKKNAEGEIISFMRDIEKESKSMMSDLVEIDDKLSELKSKIAMEKTSKREIFRMIDTIRLRIGIMEREDRREMNEEEVAETLLEKLRKWINQVV